MTKLSANGNGKFKGLIFKLNKQLKFMIKKSIYLKIIKINKLAITNNAK